MKILVTGAAGFIGFHVARHLLLRGDDVVAFDNRSPYYDVALKDARLALLREFPGFRFEEIDLADGPAVATFFAVTAPRVVVHLAAQAGVRYSLENPHAYVDANLVGFVNVLEGCRSTAVEHLVYASSSSVYGANTRVPFSTHDTVDHPISLYAATKKANELMAHSYSHLFRLPVTGLRFFTVYGPWGRPDMTYFAFTEAILAGRPINVFGEGRMRRDFTYIDDVVTAIVRLLDRPPGPDPSWTPADPDPATSSAPYRIFNVGGNRPVALSRFIEVLESQLGRKATQRLLPAQPGDVESTWADVSDLLDVVGVVPETDIEEGLGRFVAWYRAYYGEAE